LPKPKLAKFLKEFENHSNTKKKLLLESIRVAKEMIENKAKSNEDRIKIKRGIEEVKLQKKRISKYCV
jgi:hypothetical protein